MGRIGDELDELTSEYTDLFGDAAEVTNYYKDDQPIQSGEYENLSAEKTETADSPVSATIQAEQPQEGVDYDTWGIDRTVNVELLIPEEVPVSDGTVTRDDGTELAYPSRVKNLDTGAEYVILAIFNEGNGDIRCPAKYAES